MSSNILENLWPPELVRAALGRTAPAFQAFCGDGLLLLVRARHIDTDFVAAVGPPGAARASPPLKTAFQTMDFHTAFQASPPPLGAVVPVAPASLEESGEIRRRLTEESTFLVPLRKRSNADALQMDRVSIGRARNRDIVLVDPSVSKFHGWFEVDAFGSFYFSDAGSRNATRVNGRQLVSRERTLLAPADVIRFGSVDGLLCSPLALFSVLQAAAGTALP